MFFFFNHARTKVLLTRWLILLVLIITSDNTTITPHPVENNRDFFPESTSVGAYDLFSTLASLENTLFIQNSVFISYATSMIVLTYANRPMPNILHFVILEADLMLYVLS